MFIRDSIKVGENGRIFQLEVFISNISPTNNADGVVDSERLVMHAPVRPAEIPNKIQRAEAAAGNRIE